MCLPKTPKAPKPMEPPKDPVRMGDFQSGTTVRRKQGVLLSQGGTPTGKTILGG